MENLDRNVRDLSRNERMSYSKQVVQICDTDEPDGMRRHANDRGRYCRISTTGSALGGMRSQVVASLSEKRQVPPRPLSTSSAWLSRQVARPSSAIEASQPGFTVIL